MNENKIEYFPTILWGIISRNDHNVLPAYLKCIDNIDYPKDRIIIYFRTNNNTDDTVEIFEQWKSKNEKGYLKIMINKQDIEKSEIIYDQAKGAWTSERFDIMRFIRQDTINQAILENVDYYFTIDTDNFIHPLTLKKLLEWNPKNFIVSPYMQIMNQDILYSNYHHCLDEFGYLKNCIHYEIIYDTAIRGLIECGVVHCCYLIPKQLFKKINYKDEKNQGRHEYVCFSENLRNQKISQYLDNRHIYGFISFDENEILDYENKIKPKLQKNFNI